MLRLGAADRFVFTSFNYPQQLGLLVHGLLDALHERIRELAGYENLGEGAFTVRRRHLDALQRSAEHFATGQRALSESKAGELLVEELRLAQEALGEITGTVTSDDLLGHIFAEFCIGK